MSVDWNEILEHFASSHLDSCQYLIGSLLLECWTNRTQDMWLYLVFY